MKFGNLPNAQAAMGAALGYKHAAASLIAHPTSGMEYPPLGLAGRPTRRIHY